LKTDAHQNSEMGIASCILNELSPKHQIFLVEMGAYNKGGIKMLCDMAKPKIGILTGINEQHMSTFGSQENIIAAKYELMQALPPDGIAFFNARNKYCVELYEKTQGIKKFLYGQDAKFSGEENILGAIAVAKELGMTDAEIQYAVGKIRNKMPGVQIKEGIGGLKIIDSTYSANPDGVLANLEYLKNNFSGQKIIVMPCLIELGKASGDAHRRIGKKIAQVCDLAIITTQDRFAEIKETAGNKALFLANPDEMLDKIKNFAKEGDVVLLESRVPQSLAKLLVLNK
jgi:UDP-N-acetylmuramoyl-tripeptide--D-alanyl-D-alanine ligase